MATLSGNKIKNTYQSLVKFSDNGNITTTAKQLTDGFGNNSPMWVSTTQVGIGVTPESGIELHVYGDAKIGSNLTVIGNLVVEGSTTTVGTDTLTVKDPLIVLANNNTSTDAVDIGFYGKYSPSGTTLYSGLFREALTGKYRLFKDLQVEPTTTVNTSGTGYAQATLIASLEGNVIGNVTGTVSSLANHTTSDLAEGTNLYYTTARFDTRFSSKDTDDLSEGTSNLYYTTTRFNTDFSSKDTGDLTEGSNLYFTNARADARVDLQTGANLDLSSKSTSDLSEGTNLYFTTARARASFSEGTGISITSGEISIDSTVATLAGTQTLTNKTIDADNNTISDLEVDNLKSGVLDTDLTSVSASDDTLASAKAIKTYVDSQVGDNNELSEVLANGNTTGGTDIVVSTSDQIFLPNGSASNPSIAFSSNTNTGIYTNSSSIYFSVNGSEKAYIGDSQITLQENLVVYDSINADDYISIEGSTNPYLTIQDTTNEEYLNLYSSDNESAIVYTQDTFKISSGIDFLNQTPRLTIDSSGNVGIGDNSPQGKLEVNNRNTATGAALFIKGGEDDLSPISGQYTGLAFGYGGGDIYNNAAILWEFTAQNATGKLHFAVNPNAGDGTANLSDSKMTILDSGDVGIGTASPANKIQTKYSAVAIGNLTASNDASSTTNFNVNAGLLIEDSNGSNGLALGVSGQANDRKSWIQSGHPAPVYGANLGTISLNPLGGNVGIGTDTPSSKLSVFGTQAAIDFQRGTGDSKWEFSSDAASFYIAEMSTGSRDYIMTLKETTGNVGIGTTLPTSTLDVRGSGEWYDAGIIVRRDAAPTQFGAISQYNGSLNLISVVGGGGSNGEIMFSNHNAATGTPTERMRITSGGYVHAGVTATNNTYHQFAQYQTNDQWTTLFKNNQASPYGVFVKYENATPNNGASSFFYAADSTTLRFQVRSNGGVANFSGNNVNLSDERTKKEIVDAPNSLNSLCELKVRHFKYKDQTDEKIHTGLIAQEVEKIDESLVDNSGFGESDYKTIYNTDLQFKMLKAIQELKAEVDKLKQECKCKN